MQLIKKPTRTSIAQVFIKEFTKQLILNSKPKSKVDPALIERVKRKLENKPILDIPQKTRVPLALQLSQSTNRQNIMQLNRPIIRKQTPLGNMQGFPPRQIKPQTQIIPVTNKTAQISPPIPINQSDTLNLGKLKQFLSDPAVTGVECPGPDKNLLINRSGLVQASQITVSANEMQEILKEFSTKTKIPLIPGIFKALYSGFLITAVISDIAGNRFIIEKHFGQPSLPKKEAL